MVRYAIAVASRKAVLTHFKIPQNADTTTRLDESGLDVVSHPPSDTIESEFGKRPRRTSIALLLDLIREAHDAHPGERCGGVLKVCTAE